MTKHVTKKRYTKHVSILVLYDSDCGFCMWCVKQLQKLDNDQQLNPVALQTPDVLKRHNIAFTDAIKSLHVVHPDGRISNAGNAMRDIISTLRWLWPARYLWKLPGFPALMNYGYYLVANNRQQASKLLRIFGVDAQSCKLPHAPQ